MRSTLSLALSAIAAASLAQAHGDHAEVDSNSDATYAELHMAQEHHMDSFDIQAFFHLHDLNRDGVLDRNELESIYGVHHEKKRKGTKSLEVHTAQAREIVDAVLDRLDANRDGVLTMREFVAGGVGGLPNFKGVEHLGHHYDAEGEYFLHHEEQFHNTPETQTEEAYNHPEDIEHFMAHEQIEDEEEERERHFTGEESDLPEAGTAEGSKLTPEQVAQHVFNELNGIPDEAITVDEKQFVAAVEKEEDRNAAKPVMIQDKQIPVSPPRFNPSGAVQQAKQEQYAAEEKARQERAAAARAQADKFAKNRAEASKRGAWGEDESMIFAKPKDAADRMRSNIPYKFRLKKSWWGEFSPQNVTLEEGGAVADLGPSCAKERERPLSFYLRWAKSEPTLSVDLHAMEVEAGQEDCLHDIIPIERWKSNELRPTMVYWHFDVSKLPVECGGKERELTATLLAASDYFAGLLNSPGFAEAEDRLDVSAWTSSLFGPRGPLAAVEEDEAGAADPMVKPSADESKYEKVESATDGSHTPSSKETTATASHTRHNEDSDADEASSLPPSPQSTTSSLHRIIIRDASYKTYRAVLYYLATGKISFAHLSSLPTTPSSFPPLSSMTPSVSSNPVLPVSPKSIYRLADYLSLPATIAFTSFTAQLSTNNCLAELLSDLSADYDDVREVCIAAVLRHWPALVENGEIEELGRKVVEGELKTRKARLA
ncbi:hypothetical protein JCM8547_007844 [Rhodosporidiobolus lusitaniae]